MDNKNELLNEEEKKELEKKELEEKEQIGREIDELRRHNQWLKDNKEKLQDPKYILYRLPLTSEQREKLFNNLMKEEKRLKEEEENKN